MVQTTTFSVHIPSATEFIRDFLHMEVRELVGGEGLETKSLPGKDVMGSDSCTRDRR